MSNYYPTRIPYTETLGQRELDIKYLTKHLHYNHTKMELMLRKMQWTLEDIHKLRQQVEHDVTIGNLNYNFDSVIDLYYGEKQ